MTIHNLAQQNSIVSTFLSEMRDTTIQRDPMRFRTNIQRIGQCIAYEISKTLNYTPTPVTTPFQTIQVPLPSSQIVITSILRAGNPFHTGFLSYFDKAENAFVSAYRKYAPDHLSFEIITEYLAAPDINGKTLILCDPMLATGGSMEAAYRALLTHGTPAHVHIVSIIASQQAIENVQHIFPNETTTVWTAAIDPILNEQSYIIPGLGDAGDLAYGDKL